MDKEVAVAVQWWADILSGRAKQDNGDAMTGMLMNMLSDTIKPPTTEQLDIFKEALAASMHATARSGYYMSLVVDYHPDKLLREAAEKAGICADAPPFPVKTYMRIEKGSVKVNYGYRAPAVELMPAVDRGNA